MLFSMILVSMIFAESLPFDAEDDCKDGSNECVLSLRQLRASAASLKPTPKQVDDVEPVGPSTDPYQPKTADENSIALPGGWGEAEEALKSTNVQSLEHGRGHGHGNWHPQTGNVLTLYHQTGPDAGPLILQGGFRPGSQGWCGGGIYFATSPQATETKAIGPESHKGFMIEAKVNVGRVKEMTSTCDRGMTSARMHADSYDSIHFNPGDGDEYVVYSSANVLSVRHFDWR